MEFSTAPGLLCDFGGSEMEVVTPGNLFHVKNKIESEMTKMTPNQVVIQGHWNDADYLFHYLALFLCR